MLKVRSPQQPGPVETKTLGKKSTSRSRLLGENQSAAHLYSKASVPVTEPSRRSRFGTRPTSGLNSTRGICTRLDHHGHRRAFTPANAETIHRLRYFSVALI